MYKILITIAIAAACFVNSAICGENNTHLSGEVIKAYTIQVGSHKKAEDAEKELNRLKVNGLDAFVNYEAVKDKGMWHRVCVGRFASYKAAVSFAEGLVDKGIVAGFWVRTKNFHLDIEQQGVATQSPEEKDTPALAAPMPPATPEADGGNLKSDDAITRETDIPDVVNEPAAEMVEKESPPADVSIPQKNAQKKQRYSIGLKSSIRLATNASDFVISSSGNLETWTFGNSWLLAGIVAGHQLTEKWVLEASFEKDLMPELDLWDLSIGAKYQFEPIDLLVPFVRAGIVIGQFEWDEAPGNFDKSIGLDGGIGFSVTKSNLQFGIESSYRLMKYKYNPPPGNEYDASDDFIDVSGFALSATLSYLF